jgi:hypothetical protein
VGGREYEAVVGPFLVVVVVGCGSDGGNRCG